MLQRALALFLLLFSAPIWPILYVLVKVDSTGFFLFKQKRAGKNLKPFTIYKIRTMVNDADKIKIKYASLNEATGPIFKIRDDPRHTRIGRIINHFYLDELPQLFNIIKGEMAFVGPRPHPFDEANNFPAQYRTRFSILPGIIPPWAKKGTYSSSFNERMSLETKYVNEKSIVKDFLILIMATLLVLRSVTKEFKRLIR